MINDVKFEVFIKTRGRGGCFCRFFYLKFKIARIGLSIDTNLSIHIYLNMRLKALVFVIPPLRRLPMGIKRGLARKRTRFVPKWMAMIYILKICPANSTNMLSIRTSFSLQLFFLLDEVSQFVTQKTLLTILRVNYSLLTGFYIFKRNDSVKLR